MDINELFCQLADEGDEARKDGGHYPTAADMQRLASKVYAYKAWQAEQLTNAREAVNEERDALIRHIAYVLGIDPELYPNFLTNETD